MRLLALLLLALLAVSGCAAPCRTCACMPAGHGMPHHYGTRYAEPQWPYLDRNGTGRLIGDAAFREHLGVAPAGTTR